MKKLALVALPFAFALTACGGAATNSAEADRISVAPAESETLTITDSNQATDSDVATTTNTDMTSAEMTDEASDPVTDAANDAMAAAAAAAPDASTNSSDAVADTTNAAQMTANMTGRWQLAAVNGDNGSVFNLILDMTDTAGILGGSFYITEDALTANSPDGTIVGTVEDDKLTFRVVFTSMTDDGENEYWEINANVEDDSFKGDYVTIYGDTGSATGTPRN